MNRRSFLALSIAPFLAKAVAVIAANTRTEPDCIFYGSPAAPIWAPVYPAVEGAVVPNVGSEFIIHANEFVVNPAFMEIERTKGNPLFVIDWPFRYRPLPQNRA